MPDQPSHEPDVPTPPSGGRPYAPPSVVAEHERRAQRLLLLGIRVLFMVLLMTATLLPFVGEITKGGVQDPRSPWEFIGIFAGTVAFGVLVLSIDALTPNKKLGTIFGIYLGVVVGLVGALAVGALVDLVAKSWDLGTEEKSRAYIGLIKLAVGIALCYLAVSIVLTTKDDFRLVIPYVQFARQVRGVRPMLVDSSALIDGRIDDFGQTGFLDAPLVVPQFVIDELQTLADSGDKLKRARGRRGLGLVSKLQANPYVDLSIDETSRHEGSVDHMLLQTAREQNLRILTTDYNLNKVAQIHGVTVLNLNDLANTLKAQVIPGQTLAVEIVKPGESAHQGIGYLPDGTMVVVEETADRIGDSVTVTVTNSLQTAAGSMIFARLAEGEPDEPPRMAEQMARTATAQPRATARPDQGAPTTSRRNPRR